MQDFAMNVEKGYIITLDQYPAQDGNAEADRLKTSELAWQMWHKTGGASQMCAHRIQPWIPLIL